ncbi:response regulator transcription factor [Mucilaginibacter sp. L3T2-6]|uniref:response regulator transcription factor n=1 Tax=Mucilaginibacter sp. L3T2-6 TaxID=3062491 RepID=UPI002676B14E|nr:response regulator transcription factor [Mucilaginibacter sp. L3T2-6]MDO3645259.1 response regulator transcription factor [Mucilaginibacter sp. L3T2-6]MDV6217711.1 response regulator transcription factor [Mucilaginibacter sp. L3T2-6]
MIKIMLADDHHMVRGGLRAMLEKEPRFEVVSEAANGQEALDLLLSGTGVDMIIADLNMPEVGGLELTAQVKAKHPKVKVIILSALDHEKVILKALKAGANGYLLKNSSPDELIFAVKHIQKYNQYICEEITTRLVNRLLAIPDLVTVKENYDLEFTSRDIEILSLVAEGFTNQEIADKLFTSKRTIENHRQQLIDKTGSRNTVALIRFAMLHGII